MRHIRRPLLIVWDRLLAHRSTLVREFIGYSDGHIETAYLPGYAPELNPVEYIYGVTGSNTSFPTSAPRRRHY